MTNKTKVSVVRCLQHITGYNVRREDGYFWTTSGWSMFPPDNWDGGRWWLRSEARRTAFAAGLNVAVISPEQQAQEDAEDERIRKAESLS